MTDLPLYDIVALLVSFGLWLSFSWLVDYSRWAKVSLTATIASQRHEWMATICQREQRIFDGALMGNLMHSVSYLASATTLVLGGIIALLGAVDRVYETVQGIPFVAHVTKDVMELKLLALGFMFVYSFLKFTWSLRQFNYCCILIGAAPSVTAPEQEKNTFAKRASRVGELGARSFNQGLRGYYFSLAGVGWIAHPAAMVAATAIVVLILWRREFFSKTRRALREI